MSLPLPDPQIAPPGKDPGQVRSSLEGAQRNFEKLSVWGTKIEGDIAAMVPAYVSSLPGSPYDGQEVYLIDGAVDRHLRFNGSSWRPVAGKHAAAHASAGSDPLAAGSLDPTVLNANYGFVLSSGSITISTTSSPGTTLASLTVGAGEATLLLGVFLIAMPSTTDYECAIFSGASGGSSISTRGYLSNNQANSQWQQTMVWAFVTPSVDTTYRIVSWRAWGSTDATVSTGTGTMISAITLGGTP